mgnify:CR=1 FL=1
MVEAAAAFAHSDMQAKYDVKNPGALKQLVAGGAKLRTLPQEVINRAYKESMQLYSELSEKNPNWRKIYSDYERFRAEQNLWFRFTEGAFDRYMQAQKL